MKRQEDFVTGTAFTPPELPRIPPFVERWENENTPGGERALIEMSYDIVAPNVAIIMGERHGISLEGAIGEGLRWSYRLGQRTESRMGRIGIARGAACFECGIVGSFGTGFFLGAGLGELVCIACGKHSTLKGHS